jgi:hypothetical protein
MKRQLAAMMLLASAIGHVYAQTESDVYLCVDEHGKREYKNTGPMKGCKKVDLPRLTTIMAPAHKAASAPAKGASAPSDFPKVDGSAQKARDSDRRQILLDEMKSEEQKLASLKNEYNNGEPERQGNERNYAKYQDRVASLKEDIARAEKNIEALKREIGNLK